MLHKIPLAENCGSQNTLTKIMFLKTYDQKNVVSQNTLKIFMFLLRDETKHPC